MNEKELLERGKELYQLIDISKLPKRTNDEYRRRIDFDELCIGMGLVFEFIVVELMGVAESDIIKKD